jgi:adenosylcobinamide kinase/adenosylcobinamide-phosphate guanylyltransferase
VTVEEPLALPAVLAARREAGVVLVDCLTLWVANLLGTHTSDRLPAEDAFAAEFDALVAAATAHPGVVILVTNEVGWGIVPENALARRFRDILGRCHQRLAAASDQVVLCVCGCPLVVKDRASEEPHGA